MLVSILIPCYNAERWVGEAIESALQQTWTETEVIVVDDGSEDASLQIIKSFGDRIRWETGPNRGGNIARNRLLDMASADWLQYLDADDYLLPPKIERQLAFLATCPDCDVVYSPVYQIRSVGSRIQTELTPIPEPRDPWILLARWWLPQTGGPLWRRRSLVDIGGWRSDQPCCQEHELYLRLLKAGARFRYFPECYAVYRHWSNDSTVSKKDRTEVRRRRLEVKEKMEHFLSSLGELTPSRLQAINQARFEIARSAWLENHQEASNIISTIQQHQPGFLPDPPAARPTYRLAFKAFGFAAAEYLAACRRILKGHQGN